MAGLIRIRFHRQKRSEGGGKFAAVCVLLSSCLCIGLRLAGATPRFEKHVIDGDTRAESCAVADVNRDGRLDIISGEYWYEAPGWKKHRFRTIPVLNDYVDDFGALAIDVNDDGYPDVVSGSWFQKMIVWYENPKTADGLWPRHRIENGLNIEIISRVKLSGSSGST